MSALLWLAGFAIGLSCYAATAYLAGQAVRWGLSRALGVRGRARATQRQAEAGAVVAALPVEPEWADEEPGWVEDEPGWADELDEVAA